jgi:DNA end-binding protein Ku
VAEPDDATTPRRARPFWSGTIAFGLVSLPVSLYPANKTSRVSLRMVDAEGVPLGRRYFGGGGERPLERDDIVRGYEVEDGSFVIVEDDELESLAPERSQEIDLTRFVDLAEIDPTFFERGYFLAPKPGAIKAYRLLAHTMEDAGRAGIATFVMRGKEYLVALVAQGGILRAETLRFADEHRRPEDVGLPSLTEPDGALVARLEGAIERLAADEVEPAALEDPSGRRLLDLVAAKRAAGEGVVERPKSADDATETDAAGGEDAVDLMAVLKRSLEEAEGAERADEVPGDLRERTKAELYRLAQDLDVPGRSAMGKDELVEAITQAR